MDVEAIIFTMVIRAIRAIMFITRFSAIMAITAVIAIAAIMANTIITAILMIKAIRSIISNKAIHVYVAANMTNTDFILDAIASQEIPYIQVTYSLTYSLTELKSPSRSGLQAFQTGQSYQ